MLLRMLDFTETDRFIIDLSLTSSPSNNCSEFFFFVANVTVNEPPEQGFVLSFGQALSGSKKKKLQIFN